ncbi:hypothetical protein niasHS_008675 [Heterodera schachtii]|uniref:C3H1-type domain-containing protein n=1 Tax=Heterodera schachtii TaxID=97005 RepID=A0ABD2JAW9_HETSC
MPPKNAPKTSKKAEEKKKQKVLEDRTFGMKNKKLRAQMEKNIMGAPSKQFTPKKKQEDEDLKDINKIFKPVVQATQQKVSADVDPKSVLCVFFKQGLCTKGNKCKFSHDLSIQQKTMKKNLYVDSRDLGDKKDETNENWDEKTLQDVAEKKHGEKDRKRPNQTDILCKYFLEAVENSKYGWFWECPNGDTCIYRHALPPGYILKKDKKKMEEQNRLTRITLEEFIETERSKLLDQNLTKVTLDTFLAWKKKKMHEKRQAQRQSDKNKLATFKSGKQAGLSGRDLFTFNPELIAEQNGEDDDEANEVAQYEREEQEEGETDEQMHAFEIDEGTFQDLKLDDEAEDDTAAGGAQNVQSSSATTTGKVVVFDAELFQDEAGMVDDDDDELLESNSSTDDDDNDDGGVQGGGGDGQK